MREPEPVVVPQMNPNDEHAVLVSWYVASGTKVNADDPVAVVETTKATFDVMAPRAGFLFFDVPPRTMVPVLSAIGWVNDEPTPPLLKKPVATTSEAAALVGESRFTRKALRLMKQHGLTEADFPGAIRVDVEQVELRAKGGAASTPAAANTPSDAEPLDQSPSKLIEAARLADVYRNVVPSTVAISVSVAKLAAQLAALAREGGPVSVLEVVIHALPSVLADFPELEGFFQGGRAWHYRATAVGFAVNLGRGLKVPVVRTPANPALLDVARAVRDLSLRYMRDELAMPDVVGGTFTVTDLSGYGVTHFIPVLNDRQAAILGICAERPGTGTRDLVLTFDHRLSDGMRAAAFLNALRERLEDDGT